MPWLLVGITFSAALVAGLALVLATNNWWLLPAALAVHLLGTVAVVGLTGSMLRQTSKPDAATEARIDEEGVRPVTEQPARSEPVEDKPHEANPFI